VPDAPLATPALRLDSVVVNYGVKNGFFGKRRLLRAVDHVSLDIAPGEIVGLVGESGSGKSTVGRIASDGGVEIAGENVPRLNSQAWRDQRRLVQVIQQDPESALNPQRQIGGQLEEALVIHHIGTRESRRQRVTDMLAAVAMQNYADRYPHQLSGGQLQRIVIARALLLEPQLLICDEPVSALDVSVQAQVINLLQDLQRQLNLAILFISHDLGIVRHISHRIAVMYLGRIVELGPSEQVFDAPRHPYTRALLSAIPASTPWDKRPRIKLEGEPPTPLDPPSGCTFHPRCAFATPACTTTRPEFEAADGRYVACLRWRDIADRLNPEPEAVPV
jgi:oligopeptide/dipeptide ABC transporter ATP-binding protein